eukprot:947202-Lingulodinium_polyedra.AAC.1
MSDAASVARRARTDSGTAAATAPYATPQGSRLCSKTHSVISRPSPARREPGHTPPRQPRCRGTN